MTCRACHRPFGKGMTGESHYEDICRDCVVRELSYHGAHAPGTKCIDHLLKEGDA